MTEASEKENSEQSADRMIAAFSILCVSCGVKIREKASEDSYGLCLRCFYTGLAKRLSVQRRASAGGFVSER